MLRDVSRVSLDLAELIRKISHPKKTAHPTTGQLGEEVQMEVGVNSDDRNCFCEADLEGALEGVTAALMKMVMACYAQRTVFWGHIGVERGGVTSPFQISKPTPLRQW